MRPFRFLGRGKAAPRGRAAYRAGARPGADRGQGGLQAGGGFGAGRADLATWDSSAFTQRALDAMYVQSWAINKAVSIPVDDSFVQWRTFAADSEDVEAVMKGIEDAFSVRDKLARAMKMGRLYGTGMVLIVTAEDMLEEPLDPMRIRRGDLRALHVFSKFDSTVIEVDTDFASPTLNEPLIYELSSWSGHVVRVHRSRILRFDGLPPLGDNGDSLLDPYGWWWGRSLVPQWLRAANAEEIASMAASSLIETNGILLLKDDSMVEEYLAGSDTDRERIREIRDATAAGGMVMTGSDAELDRVQSPISGVAPVLEALSTRLAAAAGIPHTRFLSESPTGWQSGASERNDYAVLISELQNRMLRKPLELLDSVLARSAGLAEAPTFEFLPLLDDSGVQQAELVSKLSMALAPWYVHDVISDEEVRSILRTAPMLDGPLGKTETGEEQ